MSRIGGPLGCWPKALAHRMRGGFPDATLSAADDLADWLRRVKSQAARLTLSPTDLRIAS